MKWNVTSNSRRFSFFFYIFFFFLSVFHSQVECRHWTGAVHHFLSRDFCPSAAPTTKTPCWETLCHVLLRQQHQKSGGGELARDDLFQCRRKGKTDCGKHWICKIKDKSCLLERKVQRKKKWSHISLFFFFRASEFPFCETYIANITNLPVKIIRIFFFTSVKILKLSLLSPNTTSHSWLDYLWKSVFENSGCPHILIPVIAAGRPTAAARSSTDSHTHARYDGLMIYSIILTDAGLWFMLNYKVCGEVKRSWYSSGVGASAWRSLLCCCLLLGVGQTRSPVLVFQFFYFKIIFYNVSLGVWTARPSCKNINTYAWNLSKFNRHSVRQLVFSSSRVVLLFYTDPNFSTNKAWQKKTNKHVRLWDGARCITDGITSCVGNPDIWKLK